MNYWINDVNYKDNSDNDDNISELCSVIERCPPTVRYHLLQ